MFQQEAICVGPGFQNDNSSDKNSPTRKTGESVKKSTFSKRRSGNEVSANDQDYTKDSNIDSYSQDKNQSDMPIVEGFRIMCSGRLQMSPRSKPAEKAESVVITRGVLPFNTFDQNIDFKQTYATNAYGTIGIKV